MTSKTEATGNTSPTVRAMGRTVIGPLKAQTIAGTIKGQMRCSENNAGANATLGIAVKLVQSNGTDRSVLLDQTAADLINTTAWEMATTLTNRRFGDASENASIALTSQSASAGDYLVIEWGFRSQTTTSRNITLSYGNNSATDLPENTSTTAANNPWWEFSADIEFDNTVITEAEWTSTDNAAEADVRAAAVVQSAGEANGTSASSVDGEAAAASTIEETEWDGAGTSTADVLAAAFFAVDATGVGESTASADGQSLVAATFTASAAADASADGQSPTTTTFTITSGSTAAADGDQEAGTTITEADAEANGTSTASAASAWISAASFDAEGISTVSGNGAAAAQSAFTASGQSESSVEGQDAQPGAPTEAEFAIAGTSTASWGPVTDDPEEQSPTTGGGASFSYLLPPLPKPKWRQIAPKKRPRTVVAEATAVSVSVSTSNWQAEQLMVSEGIESIDFAISDELAANEIEHFIEPSMRPGVASFLHYKKPSRQMQEERALRALITLLDVMD
jgi:hypothetical protein